MRGTKLNDRESEIEIKCCDIPDTGPQLYRTLIRKKMIYLVISECGTIIQEN